MDCSKGAWGTWGNHEAAVAGQRDLGGYGEGPGQHGAIRRTHERCERGLSLLLPVVQRGRSAWSMSGYHPDGAVGGQRRILGKEG
ncbi:MAG: hypothetical protein OJF47_003442 [Nitrospira sp.]|jgi:hypothetical protein|nr:MAG: hypothetical protein OJF47_003442 [Nitrospira sp.]